MVARPLPAETAAPGPQAPGAFVHIEDGMVDDATLAQVGGLLTRAAGKSLPSAKALALWVNELIIYRDARGSVVGAYGFRFLNVEEGEVRFRVLYCAFAAADERSVNARQQLGQVAIRIYGRERLRTARLPIIWVMPPSKGGEHAHPGGIQSERRLAARAASSLPQNLRLYTDQEPHPGDSNALPIPVESALVALLNDQRQAEKDAQAGRMPVPLWKRLSTKVAAAGLIASALLLTLGHPGRWVNHASDSVRTKGGTALHVYRQSADGAQPVVSGSPFAAGDHIRFAVDLSTESRVAVIGVEATGNVYVAWPPQGSQANGIVAAGVEQELEGAMSLDGTVGRETLYLVACSPTSIAPVCRSRGPGLSPSCPSGCTMSPFVLDKQGASRAQ